VADVGKGGIGGDRSHLMFVLGMPCGQTGRIETAVEAASHSRHHVRHRDVAVVAPGKTPALTRFPEPRNASVTPTSPCPTPGRGSTSRDDFGPLFTPACRGDWPPRRLWAPEIAGSTPAGQTKALACDADQRPSRLCRRGRPLRRRGEAVPASLMSSRPWVRIPPALLHLGT
jgi:hypothetical protein